eukprot:m.107740 g.107740  ORF g.107740 m.107740 type:complete len:147 (+) comp51709_c0_seq3:90-530(+)
MSVLASLQGTVIKGFGRGSKELGIPTANLDDSVIDALPASMTQGIYYGWAQVAGDVVRKSVMSIGWNPFFKNEKRSAEVHLLHKFDADFYGRELRVLVLGHIRSEKNFSSLDELIQAIQEDIRIASEALDAADAQALQAAPLFTAQ